MSGVLDDLKDMARDLVSQVGEKVGVSGLKDALDEIEQAGRKTRLDASVKSAVALTPSEKDTLESRLRARFGEDLPITYEQDPGILGGLIVRVGDRYIDGSVAARLGQLRKALTGGG